MSTILLKFPIEWAQREVFDFYIEIGEIVLDATTTRKSGQ
jgi:hypothetical protein